MAKHRARAIRARAEQLAELSTYFASIADELETQALVDPALGDENPGQAEPECPWETGIFAQDFVTFYQMEISDKSRPAEGAKPDLARPFSRMSKTREGQVNAREKDGLLIRDNWSVLAEAILGCSFLRGYGFNKRWSGATLPWVINPTNCQKILEGNYPSDRQQNAAPSGYAESERQLNQRFDDDEKGLEGGRAE